MFQVALLVISFELTSQHKVLQEFWILLSVCSLWYSVLFSNINNNNRANNNIKQH